MPHQPPLGFPALVQFLNVTPGTFVTSAGGGLPRHDGDVIVRIEGDPAQVFSVSSLEELILVRDPDVPHSPPTWETDATQDGAGPIALNSAQALAVFVGFACPANPAQQSFTATAVVQTTDATPVTLLSLPIEAAVSQGSVSLELLSAPPMFAGEIASFGFRIRSSIRQEVGGVLTCDAPAPFIFSSDTDPAFPIVGTGGSVDVTLPVLCAAGTPIGNYSAIFRFKRIDNSLEFATLDVPIKVMENRTVSVNPSLVGDQALDQGSSTRLELRIDVSGTPTTFNIEAVSIPSGVSVSNSQQRVAVDRAVFLGMDIEVAPDAPIGKANAPLTFNWSVPGDDFHLPYSGSFSYQIGVDLVTVSYVPQDNPINSGNVQASGVSVTFSSNGNWNMRARLHDFSTIFGDNFALGFAFNFTDGASHGPMKAGELGSSLTRNPETLLIGINGNDPWLKQNWQKAFALGGIFRLHTSGDFSQVLSDIGDDFKNFFKAVYVSFEGTDCPTDDAGVPACGDTTENPQP